MRVRVLFWVCVGCWLLSGRLLAQPAPADSLVLARVNGHELTVGRFNKSYLEYLIRTGRNDTPANRWRHLQLIIDTYLLADEARRRGFDQRPDFLAFADREIKLAVGARYFEKHFSDSLPAPTEMEVREAFRRSKETIALRHLFFRDARQAQEAYERLKAGEDFVQLANEVFRTEAFDSSAGFLGYVRYSELDDAVAETAETLRVGQFSPPVRSRYGWHILRVEERLYNPLLTESEFQYRRKSIETQLRLRRLRLEGDRFVRRLMESLNVQVDEAAARQVVAAVQEALRPSASPPLVSTISAEELQAVEQALTPETVLITYTLNGQQRTFTAGDYYRWLPVLPYREVRYRTMASVGRALRNEVLAELGFAEGLEHDPRVLETVRFLANAYLGDALRRHLETHERVEPTEMQVRRAFEELGYRRLKSARVHYWTIYAGSAERARQLREQITAGTLDPRTDTSYVEYRGELGRDKLSAYVRKALLQQPLVLCLQRDSCYVLYVAERTLRYTELEEVADTIRAQLARLLPEMQLLATLYPKASIEVDTTLFVQMMQALRMKGPWIPQEAEGPARREAVLRQMAGPETLRRKQP
ncbi:peptidylprolyl isomerase [Rhodothermus marinus]|uniref:peptidylprolyl isomerase n=1 Tax=Rhodothermus marinus TaxID=29549 RepID=UPI0012BA41CC|nr:peptidylprolyl isomerase [Rhodothermus marinus]BBM69270.1 hypothetical protein RmaAA213_11160 [Rhodothermus marinus]BBM72262.1 hypothetical protein RmaAA338_11270 [Rhodothermus marinus]